MCKINKQPYHLQKIIFAITIIIAIIFIGYWLEQHITAIEQWLAEMGHWAGAGFIILFVLLTPFCLVLKHVRPVAGLP